MADSRIPGLGSDVTRIGSGGTSFDFSRISIPRETIVDLSQTVEAPQVVREGFKVPVPQLDDSRSQFFIDDLIALPPREEPRVLAQSVRAGTLVPRGTAIDLTLAPPSVIKFDIFEAPHADLIGKSVTTVTEGILQNADVRQALLRFESPGDVPPAEKAMLITAFRNANVEVNDAAGANKSFDAAFNSIRGALAFR